MPNYYHNIYGDLKTAKFVEFYRPTSGGDWVYEVLSFNLKEGYTETDNLFSEMQSNFTNASGNEITRESDGSTTVQHIGETDTPTIVSVSHDSTNYLNSISFDSGTQDKVIGLYVDDQNKHTIWESLGFDKRRIIKQTDLDQIKAQLKSLAPGATALDVQGVLHPSILHMRGCSSSVAAEYRTLVSSHVGTHSNHNGIYIASQATQTSPIGQSDHLERVAIRGLRALLICCRRRECSSPESFHEAQPLERILKFKFVLDVVIFIQVSSESIA